MKWMKRREASILFLFVSFFSLPVFANLPYFPIQFPRDEAAHHANVPYAVKNLTEWWYFSGKLVTDQQREFGYFIAVFHIIPPSGKAKPDAVLMMQLTDLKTKAVYGVTKLYYGKDATFSTDKLDVQLGSKFQLSKDKSSYYIVMKELDVPKLQHKLTMMLTMSPGKAPLMINKSGLLDMYDNTNSYYYSNVRMRTTGIVNIGGVLHAVIGDNSSSWMDHQWGDFVLTPKKRWIWTSVQLNNGMDFSAFELIDADTKQVIRRLSNIIMPDDTRFYTDDIDIKVADRAKRSHYPSRYDVTIVPLNLHVTLDSFAPDQNTNGFWEGAHAAKGQYNGNLISGFSYVENTVEYQKHK